MQEVILACLLAIAAALIVVGVAQWSASGGFLAAGVLLAGWSWLTFGDVE